MTVEEMLDHLVTTAQHGIEANGEDFTEPDEDWLPVFIIGTTDDKVVVCGLDAMFLESAGTKDVLAHSLMPAACLEFDAVAVAFVSSAWVVETPTLEDLPPSQHPERKEAVQLVAMTLDAVEQWSAPIVRTSNAPPMLGPWTCYGTHPPAEDMGRMANGMYEGLQKAQEARQIE